MTNPNCDEGRRSVVAGGLRELASCSQREGVCLPERANQNDADALEDPAKRAPSSQDFVRPGSSPRTTLRSGRDRRVEYLIVAIVCLNLIVAVIK